jgi:hypothetical protein
MLLVHGQCRREAGCGRARHAANVAALIGFGKAGPAPGKPDVPGASKDAAAPALRSLALVRSPSLKRRTDGAPGWRSNNQA